MTARRRFVALTAAVLVLPTAAALGWALSGTESDPENPLTPGAYAWSGGDLPDVTFTTLNGEPVTVEEFRGQLVLLNFWATWCPPCLMEMPAMQRLEQALPSTPFSVLAVNVKETREKAWRFQQLLDVHFTVLLDKTGQAGEDWNIAVYPTSYLIDPSGHIRYVAYGALEWDSDAVRQVINDLLKESAGAGS